MGEQGGGAIGVAELGGSESPSLAAEGTGPPVATDGEAMRSALAVGRRRFVVAATTGIALMAVPFLWILWSLWGPVNLLRPTVYENNFYDLQARAMFHGHLSLAPGSLGIEGFVHDGRTYTYFGLFPSIVRMPILLVTSSLDAKLTPTYMLLAWLLTGLFTSLLLWRVRFLVRGDVVMGRMEATAFGVPGGHHHGWHRLDAPGLHPLCLQRGHRLEHLSHHRQHLRPSRRGRAAHLAPGRVQRPSDSLRQSRSRHHRVGLCGGCRLHRRMVRARVSGARRTDGGACPCWPPD